MLKKGWLLLCVILSFSLVCCGKSGESEPTKEVQTDGTVYVLITMESGDEIYLELDGKTAPITVKNFVSYVSSGFYDGLIFHRVIKNFMIQGGDPTGTSYGDSGLQRIKGEFAANGVANPISHKRGVISMARASQPLDSATSQFFICHQDSTYLDGQYAAFGHVIAGMATVDKIASVTTDANDRPTVEQKMKSVRLISEETAKAAAAAEANG